MKLNYYYFNYNLLVVSYYWVIGVKYLVYVMCGLLVVQVLIIGNVGLIILSYLGSVVRCI